MNSMPASSAIRARERQSAQLPDQRSGTRVTARPDEQLAPNRPSLSRFRLYIAARSPLPASRSIAASRSILQPRPWLGHSLAEPRGNCQARRQAVDEAAITGRGAGDPMAKNGNGKSYLYLGLAGETGRGRVVHSGMFRLADGSGEWEALERGLPEMPAVRALAVHPQKPEIVYAGTQSGAYRSADRGEHWEKVEMPDHGLPVWSVLFHPHDPDVILVGCENCEIYRSDDAGEHWTRLPVSVRFPEITTASGANPAKRVLMLDASASEPDCLYGAIEVGGTIRSTDGGEHWENLSHGQYLNDYTVDVLGVLASRWRPGAVIGFARAGMFRSDDGGGHCLPEP